MVQPSTLKAIRFGRVSARTRQCLRRAPSCSVLDEVPLEAITLEGGDQADQHSEWAAAEGQYVRAYHEESRKSVNENGRSLLSDLQVCLKGRISALCHTGVLRLSRQPKVKRTPTNRSLLRVESGSLRHGCRAPWTWGTNLDRPGRTNDWW